MTGGGRFCLKDSKKITLSGPLLSSVRRASSVGATDSSGCQGHKALMPHLFSHHRRTPEDPAAGRVTGGKGPQQGGFEGLSEECGRLPGGPWRALNQDKGGGVHVFEGSLLRTRHAVTLDDRPSPAAIGCLCWQPSGPSGRPETHSMSPHSPLHCGEHCVQREVKPWTWQNLINFSAMYILLSILLAREDTGNPQIITAMT